MPARSTPLFASLRGYRRRWLTADLLAGLSVWAVLVPESLAYATIALRRAGAEHDVLQTMYNTVDEAVAAAPAHREPDK